MCSPCGRVNKLGFFGNYPTISVGAASTSQPGLAIVQERLPAGAERRSSVLTPLGGVARAGRRLFTPCYRRLEGTLDPGGCACVGGRRRCPLVVSSTPRPERPGVCLPPDWEGGGASVNGRCWRAMVERSLSAERLTATTALSRSPPFRATNPSYSARKSPPWRMLRAGRRRAVVC